MFRAKTVDATKGPIIPQIIIYVIPLVLTTLIQTLFNAVDIAVLGLRAVWMATVYPIYQTYSNLILCFVVSWVCTLICNLVIFSVVYVRYKKGKYKKI